MEEEDSRETYPGKIKPNWDLPTVIPFNKVKKKKKNMSFSWVREVSLKKGELGGVPSLLLSQTRSCSQGQGYH